MASTRLVQTARLRDMDTGLRRTLGVEGQVHGQQTDLLNDRCLRVDAELLQFFYADPDEANQLSSGVFTIVKEGHQEVHRLPLEDSERVCGNGKRVTA